MANEADNLFKLLCLTDTLCTFVDDVVGHYNCQFEVKINSDKFKFNLPELVAEVRKYSQIVVDDIESCSDDIESCSNGDPVVEPKNQ